MYLYKEKVKREFLEFKKQAFELYLAFLREEPIEELLSKVEALDAKHDNVLKILPSQVKDESDCGRHIHWLKYWLKKKRPLDCVHDIQNICEDDIDKIEGQFDKWCSKNVNIDKDLSKNTERLLINREFSPAVVQSFKLLTDKLRRRYKIKSLDGHKLIDEIYSQTGKAKGRMNESTREGLMLLMKGMYMLFRNEHAHNKLKTKPYESEAVLSMINYLLLRLKYNKI